MKSNFGCNEIELACIICNLLLKAQDIPEIQTFSFYFRFFEVFEKVQGSI